MKNIVVTGSHGKTTTTSILSNIINGGVINSLDNSAKLGKSEWSILESDESDGSFIKVPSTYAVVTNVDREHMDYYKSLDDLKRHFIKFMHRVPSFGKTFICIDDKNSREIWKKSKIKNILTYGFSKDSNFKIKNCSFLKNKSIFDIEMRLPNKKKTILKKIVIPLIGSHNVKNATAAIAVSYFIGISLKILKNSLKNFKGVERRFNKIFSYNGADIYDDYAHHPTEIKFVLEGVDKVYKNYDKVCIFQPHRISRLRDLRKEFSFSFKSADTVILCPIYTAGEKIKLGFSYMNFAKEIIKNSKVKLFLVNDNKHLAKFVKNNMYGKKIVIGMGAGSISNWMRSIPELI
jgi:UDP-N-acetylmuramate--alanine ligase